MFRKKIEAVSMHRENLEVIIDDDNESLAEDDINIIDPASDLLDEGNPVKFDKTLQDEDKVDINYNRKPERKKTHIPPTLKLHPNSLKALSSKQQ